MNFFTKMFIIVYIMLVRLIQLLYIGLLIFTVCAWIYLSYNYLKRALGPKYWIDPKTKLMWQNEDYTEEEKKAFRNEYNYSKVRDWEGAKEYCKNLKLEGYDDWRLPNIYELSTLVTHKKGFPTLKIIKDPLSYDMAGLEIPIFWSSSKKEFIYNNTKQFIVKTFNFEDYNCDSLSDGPQNYNYVLCVRGKEIKEKKQN